MTAGMIPSLTSEKPNTVSGRSERDIRAGDEPGAATECVAVHARDDGSGAAIDRLAHPVEAKGILGVLVERKVDGGPLPLDVGSGAEALAVSGQHDDPGIPDSR